MDYTNVLSTVFQNIFKLFPFRFQMIDCTTQGAKFSRGDAVKLLTHENGLRIPRLRWNDWFGWLWGFKTEPTGIHFRWVFFEYIEIHDIRPWVFETQYQTVQTRDGKPLSFSLSVEVEIFDALTYETSRSNHSQTLENRVQAVLTTQVVDKELSDILDYFDEFCENLRKELADELEEEWGIHLHRIQPVNLTTVMPIRLMGDSSFLSE